MIALERCNKLLNSGYSLLTVGENKVPNFSWGKNQETPLNLKEFEKRYNYNCEPLGDNGTILPKTNNIGFITGYKDLEVIDVDLKVLNTAKEKRDIWDEYLSYLEDSILDFHDKVVIYKTKSAGYHILYRCKKIGNNKKLAKLKGHKEALIETRGAGGYVFLYDGNNYNDKLYEDVDYISEADRDLIIEISKSYNYVEDIKLDIPKKIKKEYSGVSLPSWTDYNEKTNILDLLNTEFKVVRNLKNKYVIKRDGAESPHSGYVYKDSNTMFLFSTGTSFENEKLYNPFTVYAHLNCNNDLSLAAKELYKLGFGERLKPLPIIEREPVNIPKQDLIFPIEIYPEVIQKYISSCNDTLNNSVDYMACAMMFVASISIGNSLVVEVKRGWKETANIWLALVGKAGIGKTPSINSITFPLDKINNREIKRYIKDMDKFISYQEKSKKEKELIDEAKQPIKKQFIVNDITLEALIDLHAENKNGIGVNKDELAGWFKDMNKYRQGSDLEHWLSSWSGKQINMNRKTAKSSFVDKAFIPVLGGIQPGIMDGFYTEENKDSGFIDRMLFCYPELQPNKYNIKEMPEEYLQWYEDYIISFYETIKKLIKYDKEQEINPIKARFNESANKEWIRIHDEIISLQTSDDENEYMKSMLPKQISYIPRYALIINTLMSFEHKDYVVDIIRPESVLKAEKLSKYFIAMAKKIKVKSNERNDAKNVISKLQGKSNHDKYIALKTADKNISKKEIANILGVSVRMIYKYEKKQQENEKTL